MSLSHRCGGILAHSSLQNCFNSATLEGFQAWKDCLRSCHSISIKFKSGLWGIKCSVGFTPDVTGHTPSKKFNFCHISPLNNCPKVLGIIKIFFANVFLVSNGFCLGTLPWMPFLSSLFLIVESWTLTLIEASEACSSLDVVVGSLMTSWMSRHCALGVILVGQPLLGRFTTLPSFLHLWIMALTVVRWSPKALEIIFITLSRLIHVNCFVSHLFLNFFRSWPDVLLFKHASLFQTGSI